MPILKASKLHTNAPVWKNSENRYNKCVFLNGGYVEE